MKHRSRVSARTAPVSTTPDIPPPTEIQTHGGMCAVNRAFKKCGLPDDVAPPPVGWCYVGKGVVNQPLFKHGNHHAVIRFTPPNTSHNPCCGEGYNKWAGYNRTAYVGVIPECHYAVPMEVWDLLDWADAKDDPNSHRRREAVGRKGE